MRIPVALRWPIGQNGVEKAFFCEQPIAVFVGDPVTLIYDLHPTETTNTSHE